MSLSHRSRTLLARLGALPLTLLALSSRAHADEEGEAAIWEQHPGQGERDPEEVPRADLWLGVTATVALEGASTHAGAMLVLGGKLEAPLKLPGVRAHAAALAKAAPDAKEATLPVVLAAPPAPLAPLRARPRLGALARGAVEAAHAAAGSEEVEARLGSAATRARASGLVPELRLRVAHVLDEDQRLAPTEYDPDRITASGGTSLWLEARATFRLDRLVFADDEVALERLRADRAKLEADLAGDVLKSFEQWMRAEAALEDEAATEEDRLRADLDAAVAEARLDALTGGWFSSRRAQMKSSDKSTVRVDEAVSSF